MRREQRLRRPADFTAVHRRGRTAASDTLLLRSLRTGQPQTRVGFAVGKRVGNAVVRNRVKRRLRAAVTAVALAPGWDVVIIARTPAAAQRYAPLAAGLHALLRRAGLVAAQGTQPAAPFEATSADATQPGRPGS